MEPAQGMNAAQRIDPYVFTNRPPEAAMMGLKEAASAVGGALHGKPVRFSGVTTDSRKVAPGDLFVALSGERFDGNAFVEEAVRQGAVAALTSRLVATDRPVPQVVVAD